MWSLFTTPDTSRARLARLVADYPGRFATHQVEGVVLMALGEIAPARAAFEKAAAPALPEESEFVFGPDVLAGRESVAKRLKPAGQDLWLVDSLYDILPGGPLKLPESMKVIRLADGGLALVNPVRLDALLARALDALGPVRLLVTNTGFHYFFIADYQKSYPAARLYGPGLHRSKPEVRHLRYAGYLSDDAPVCPGEIDQIHFAGHAFDETALHHRASRSLILTDLATHGAEPKSVFWNFYCWLWGRHRRFGCLAYHRLMVKDRAQVEGAVKRTLETGFAQVLVAHGPPVTKGAQDAFETAWRNVLARC